MERSKECGDVGVEKHNLGGKVHVDVRTVRGEHASKATVQNTNTETLCISENNNRTIFKSQIFVYIM